MKTFDKIHAIHILSPLILDTTNQVSKAVREKAETKIGELIDSLVISTKKEGGENVTAS
jgi:hypothetical protein